MARPFRDWSDAEQRLVIQLHAYVKHKNVVVLALPRRLVA
jgi:predicted phosphoribosyltransferase